MTTEPAPPSSPAAPAQEPASPAPSRAKGIIIFCIKVSIAALIIGLLWYSGKMKPEEVWATLSAAWTGHPWLLAISVLLILFVPALTAIRWRMLLATQDVPITLWQAISMTWIGLLFTLLPGGLVAGDAAKAVIVARDAEHRAAAATSVYMDRAVGLMTVLFIGAAGGLAAWGSLNALPPVERAAALTLVCISAGGFVLGVAGFAFAFSRHFAENPLMRWIGAHKSRLFRLLHTVAMAVHSYRGHLRALGRIMLVSLAAQGFIMIAVILMGRAMEIDFPKLGETGLWIEVRIYFMSLAVGEIANAFPFTPGGFGQLEGALDAIFKGFGSDKGFTLGLMWHAMGYFSYLFGIVFLLMSKRKAGATSGRTS